MNPYRSVPQLISHDSRSTGEIIPFSWIRQLWIVAISLFVITLNGCGSSRNDDPNTVRLSLNWFPDAQHGGFYAALEHGFYEEEGLTVEIIPGGPGVPVIEKVALGRSEFGVSNADQILLKRNQDARVVALMAPLQNSPRCIMVHEESSIESIDQLQGVTLALGPGRPFAEFMKSRASLQDVQIVNYSGSVTRFVQDKSFAQQAYVFSEPFVARQRGASPRSLMLSDLGYNPYSSCVFAKESYVDEHSDVVRRFVRATVRGWQAYLEDPATTNQIIHQANPEMDLESLEFGSSTLKSLCLPEGLDEKQLGTMSDERWQLLVEQLKEIGFVSDDFTSQGAYRTDFLR